MSARNTRLLALVALMGSSLSLGACSTEEDPPLAMSGGSAGTGGVPTGVTAGGTTSGSTDDTTSETGDGDGDAGDGDAGDGDAGDGDGDTMITTMSGDGDGDGDGDTGSASYQECIEFASAAGACGIGAGDIQAGVDYCQTTFDYATDVGGTCLGSAIQYWDCRTNLGCSMFLVDGPAQCALDANLDTTCPDFPAPSP